MKRSFSFGFCKDFWVVGSEFELPKEGRAPYYLL